MSNRQTFAMGILFGLVVALGAFVALRSPEVAVAAGTDSSGRIGMVTGLVEGNYDILYVLDSESKRLLVYGTDHNRHLGLYYGRNITWDLQVQDFENRQKEGPKVGEMKKQAEEAAKNDKGGEGGGLK